MFSVMWFIGLSFLHTWKILPKLILPSEITSNLTPVTTTTIPYIKGTSEAIARIVAFRNPCSSQTHDRQGAVYRIKCTDYQVTYIEGTVRNLNTKLTERKRATKNGDIKNHIPEHHRPTEHKIDRDSICWTYRLQHKLPTMTDIRKLVNKLRRRTSDPMPTTTWTLQTTHTWPQTKSESYDKQ